MDHELVVRQKFTEKYLLEELSPELREEFEAHFFDCPECARDVRAASEFITHSKTILAEKPQIAEEQQSGKKRTTPWFAWLRPAFAIPALALLLIVIGYQNLVTLPKLTRAANQPQLLPAATLNLLTYGSNSSPLLVHQGEGFLLNVIVPPGHSCSACRVDLYDPAGKLEASLSLASSGDDTWSIHFPAANRQSGTYKLVVLDISGTGERKQIGSNSFELKIQ